MSHSHSGHWGHNAHTNNKYVAVATNSYSSATVAVDGSIHARLGPRSTQLIKTVIINSNSQQTSGVIYYRRRAQKAARRKSVSVNYTHYNLLLFCCDRRPTNRRDAVFRVYTIRDVHAGVV